MGSCGSFTAKVSVSFSIKKKEKNTEEDILHFMKYNKITFSHAIKCDEDSLVKALEEGTQVIIWYEDWESWDSREFNSTDYTREVLDVLEEYYDSDKYTAETSRLVTSKDLEYINLKLLEEKSITSIDATGRSEQDILDCSGDIYCENDNSEEDSCTVKKYEDLLSLPEAELILNADGDGNC
jgi:hypothetical protein